ncbi:hypothetical protein D0T50_07315 [Bacteroides sp. 214]|nr:hypothetical protein [Bacteroides sp. 214]
MLIILTLYPREFAYVRSFYFFTTIIAAVVPYQFIFILTRIDNKEKFPKLHYILPTAIFLVHLIWSLSIPKEVAIETSFYSGKAFNGYHRFYIFASLIAPIRFMFGIGYSALSIIRYRRYQHAIVEYAADPCFNSLHWLRTFLFLWISLLIVPIFGVLFTPKALIGQLLAIPAILLFAQHLTLCFNAIRGNYLYIGDSVFLAKETPKEDKNQLSHETVMSYIEDRKPYLNPQFSIAEMANDLSTNRSYLSVFINKTYGTNFSQFMNRFRLEELERIENNPIHTKKSNLDKITLAGFGSDQAYRYTLKKKEENESFS